MVHEDRGRDDLVAAASEVHTELQRADSKAAMLLALAGAAAALVASSDLPSAATPAVWVIRAGLGLLVAAVVVLLGTVRPRLARAPFMQHTSNRAADWRPESPSERMANLSAVARAKFTRIRLAVDLLAVGVLALGAGIAWTGVG